MRPPLPADVMRPDSNSGAAEGASEPGYIVKRLVKYFLIKRESITAAFPPREMIDHPGGARARCVRRVSGAGEISAFSELSGEDVFFSLIRGSEDYRNRTVAAAIGFFEYTL